MKDDRKFVSTDSLRPEFIISDHIQKTLQSETPEEFISNVRKFEDLMTAEVDDLYEKELKDIEKQIMEMPVSVPYKISRSNYDETRHYKDVIREREKKHLIFRALVKLAKRRGKWTKDREPALLSWDKKKRVFTDMRY